MLWNALIAEDTMPAVKEWHYSLSRDSSTAHTSTSTTGTAVDLRGAGAFMFGTSNSADKAQMITAQKSLFRQLFGNLPPATNSGVRLSQNAPPLGRSNPWLAQSPVRK